MPDTPEVRGLSPHDIGALEEWMKTVNSKLECLLVAWGGNGKPGIKEELTIIKMRIKVIDDWKNTIDSNLRYFFIVFVLFVSGVLWGILTDKINIVIK
jgi:hypothetical protein